MDSTVTVVLDGEFGDRVRELAGPLWIADSATNVDAIRIARRDNPAFRPTTFRDDPSRPQSDVLATLLPTIDLHHGELSQDPPYDRLVVYGARPNHAVRAILADFGFRVEEELSEGFSASRVAAA